MFWIFRSREERALLKLAHKDAREEAKRLELERTVRDIHDREIRRVTGPPPKEAQTANRYEVALAALDRKIAATMTEAEAEARIKYKEWLLDREKRKLYFVRFGVNLPITPLMQQRDQFFESMRKRLEGEQAEFRREADRIARDEIQQIEHQKFEADRADREQLAITARSDAAAIERERLEAEKAAVAMVAEALAGDFK